MAPFDHGSRIGEAYQQAFGDPLCTVLCAHDGRQEPGARTAMAVYPDRRVAVYLHEVGA
jgi:hypothetical protein